MLENPFQIYPHYSSSSRKQHFVWSANNSAVFEKMKTLLTADTCLGYFDPDLHTIVMADTSPVGLGANLQIPLRSQMFNCINY